MRCNERDMKKPFVFVLNLLVPYLVVLDVLSM